MMLEIPKARPQPAQVVGKAGEIVLRVYGDSLGLPRAFEQINPGDTYTERLVDAFREVFPETKTRAYNRSGGGLTIEALYDRYINDCSYFGTSLNQIIIIHSGIVDCAPRPVPPSVRNLIARLHGWLRLPISKVLHASRPCLLRLGLSWRLTSPSKFSSTLRLWLDHAIQSGYRLYVINIAPPTPSISLRSPGVEECITEYNNLISDVVAAHSAANLSLIDVHSAIQKSNTLTTFVNEHDGHHITIAGHQLYSKLIWEAMNNGL
jgi:hypothetical protein